MFVGQRIFFDYWMIKSDQSFHFLESFRFKNAAQNIDDLRYIKV